jgi:hypothetical protein
MPPPGEKLDTGLPICMLDVISDVRTMGEGMIVPRLPVVMVAIPKPDTVDCAPNAACAGAEEEAIVVDAMLAGGASSDDTLKVSRMLKSSVSASRSNAGVDKVAY